MATELNFVANIDTSRILGAVSEIRSQIGMAMGGAGPQMGGMMYNPGYGVVQASTSLQQEQAVHSRGLAAANAMKPPGVSAMEYGMGVESNYIDRRSEAAHSASLAGQSALVSGGAGLLAGEAAWRAARPVGTAIGSRIGSRILGAGAGGAIGAAGGMIAGVAAYGLAEEYISGKVQSHFSDIQSIGQITKELGDIAGGGRGLGREREYQMGMAARDAAKNIGMDVGQMAATLSLGREAGMLPSTADPQKAKQQFADFARAVDEGASVLHTSLAQAVQVLKTASQQGISADEGILRTAAMGGPEAMARYQAFGQAGAGAARGMGFSGSAGFGLFTAGIAQASGAANTEQTKALGGRYGVASLIGGGIMQAAASPMGDLQMMAGMTGDALGGMMGMPGQAMAGLEEFGGGDLMTGMMRFQVNRDDLRRGLGSKEMKTMARQQLTSGAEQLRELGMGGTDKELYAFQAMNQMGMDPTQAKAYVSGLFGGGGGGGGGAARARRAQAWNALSEMRAGYGKEGKAKEYSLSEPDGYGFGLEQASEWSNYGMVGGTAVGAGVGLMAGGAGAAPGAIAGGGAGWVAGAVAGAVTQNAMATYRWAKEPWMSPLKGMRDEQGNLVGARITTAQEKADFFGQRAGRNYQETMDAWNRKVGHVDLNDDLLGGMRNAALKTTALSLDDLGEAAAVRLGGPLLTSGITEVSERGPGTITAGGRTWKTADVREWIGKAGKTKITDKQEDIARAMMRGNRDSVDNYRTAKLDLTNATTKQEQKDAYWRLEQARGILYSSENMNAANMKDVDVGAIDRVLGGALAGEMIMPDAATYGDVMFTAASTQSFAEERRAMAWRLSAGIGGGTAAEVGVFSGLLQEKGFRGDVIAGRMGKVNRRLKKEEILQNIDLGTAISATEKGGGGKTPLEMAGPQIGGLIEGAVDLVNSATGGAIANVADKLNTKISTKEVLDNVTKVAKDVQGGKGRRGGKGGGEGGMSRTVGWGESESAMDSINRSLKKTHHMIDVLNKKVGKTSKEAK